MKTNSMVMLVRRIQDGVAVCIRSSLGHSVVESVLLSDTVAALGQTEVGAVIVIFISKSIYGERYRKSGDR